jgi:hypothetical protein
LSDFVKQNKAKVARPELSRQALLIITLWLLAIVMVMIALSKQRQWMQLALCNLH